MTPIERVRAALEAALSDDKPYIDRCKEALSELDGMVIIRADVVTKLANAITGYNAAVEMMLDSAHEKTDLTDEGIANLMNASIALGDEALNMLQPYTKGE